MRNFFSVLSFFAAGISYLVLAKISSANVSSPRVSNSICPQDQFANLCNLKLTDNSPVVSNIITILLIVASLLALIFLIWGSIRWILSGGDKGKVDEARKTIMASIVGLILAFLAFFILNMVTWFFTGNTITTFEIPTIVP